MMNPQAKLLWQGDRVKSWLEGDGTCPVLVEIAPTGYCNASCPWCDFRGKHSDEAINKNVMLSTLRDLVRMKVKAINWTGGGEPTLHPNFNEFVIEANERGIEQGLFTNAYTEIENPSMFEWIRISLTDKGYDPIKVPDAYFGICLNMLPTTTSKKLWELCSRARDIGAAYFQVRPALVGYYKNQPPLSPPTYLKEYETSDFEVIVTPYKFEEATKPHRYSQCYGYHFCPSIDWRGKIGVCLYRMGEEKYVFGDLNRKSFVSTWIRKDVPMNLVDAKCQNCCKNHEINKILFTAKQARCVNFL